MSNLPSVIQLQNNNAELSALVSRVNAAKDVAASLPNAGGGSAVETCTGTIKASGATYANSVWFTNGSMQPESCTPGSKIATSFTAVKGSVVFIYRTDTASTITLSGATLLYSSGGAAAVSIDSDNFQITNI